MIKVIIAGSRTFDDYERLKKECNHILFERACWPKHMIEVVSGTANGADKLGEIYANEYSMKLTRFPADWNQYGKSAGYKRNEQMAQYAMQDSELGVLIAFWDGKSKGTKHMIDLADKYGLEVFVIKFNKKRSYSKDESMGDMISTECGEVPWDYY